MDHPNLGLVTRGGKNVDKRNIQIFRKGSRCGRSACDLPLVSLDRYTLIILDSLGRHNSVTVCNGNCIYQTGWYDFYFIF